MKKLLKLCFVMAFAVITGTSVSAQADSTLQKEIDSLKRMTADYEHRFDVLSKQVDDLMWISRMENIAYFDKVRLTSTPRWKPRDTTDRFANNKLQFYTYVFIPKNVDVNKKYPLIVLPHSGIHADFSTYYARTSCVN